MADDLSRHVTILYFAWLRERVGTAEERILVPEGLQTVGEFVEWLSGRSPGHRAAFQNRAVVRCAVNQEFADPSMPVSDGDELAFFPPVTGG